jgi:hypothetical protein
VTLDLVGLLCREHGLPVPEREQRFDPVRKWRADYLWQRERVILEIDGGIYRGGAGGGTGRGGHSTASGIVRDMEKSNAAQLAGFRYLRATPRDVTSGAIVALLKRALRV